MPDIFISYSRKDSELALALAQRLRGDGIDVWIDQKGIIGAEQWATEIVEGIRACSTFIILLSPNSIASENVLRELSLASEKRKRVLPVDLAPTILPSSFEYPLAGLQRVAISDFEGIMQAHKHGVSRIVIKDIRKSLIVLPFEDLSPAGEDNTWFADGLAGEMIDALSHIKSLCMLDRKTSLGLRGAKLRTVEIGKEFNTRYFIEGSVRKFGEQIKISVSLLDIETGDCLWQESHRGKFEDIFEIQEAVANKVVEGLKLHLTNDEKEKMLERGTQNADAYELYIKAEEYFLRKTHEGFRHAAQLFSDAICLDPGYANAYRFKGLTLIGIYRDYDSDPKLLIEAESLVREALRLKPDLWNTYYTLSLVYLLQEKFEEAERAVCTYIEKAPDDPRSYWALGYFYGHTGQPSKSIAPYEQGLWLMPDYLPTLWNVILSCSHAQDLEKLAYWASYAIPRFERHLKLHPDDEMMRVCYTTILSHAGHREEARKAAWKLDTIRDGGSLSNTASLWVALGDSEMALKTIHKSIEAGFKNVPALNRFLETEQIDSLKSTSEYAEVRKMVDKIVTEEKERSISLY